jgi:hypothetical protein
MKSIFSLCLAACLLASNMATADVSLLGGSELGSALNNSPPCCVIDGRKDLSRAKAPLPDALPYRLGMNINPTATVVVLADSDSEALRIAGIFEKQRPGKRILAVKGGLNGWLAATAAPASKALGNGAPSAAFQFVIPHNTCETGEPLQKLQSNKK